MDTTPTYSDASAKAQIDSPNITAPPARKSPTRRGMPSDPMSSVVVSDPIPLTLRSTPCPLAPTSSTSTAKIGISARNDIPKKLLKNVIDIRNLKIGSRLMNLRPVIMSWIAPAERLTTIGGECSESTTRHIAMNPAVAAKNTAAVPSVEMINPANAGAPIRVPCQIVEFIATALAITRRSIRCGYSAWRAGCSKAPNAPVMKRRRDQVPRLDQPRERQHAQKPDHHRQHDLPQQDQHALVHPVRHHATRQIQHDRRHRRGHAHVPKVQRRAGKLVGQPALRHVHHLEPGDRSQRAQPVPAKTPGSAAQEAASPGSSSPGPTRCSISVNSIQLHCRLRVPSSLDEAPHNHAHFTRRRRPGNAGCNSGLKVCAERCFSRPRQSSAWSRPIRSVSRRSAVD